MWTYTWSVTASNRANVGIPDIAARSPPRQIHAEFHVESVVDSWKAMEQIQRDGLARSIGISNFSTKSLQSILDTCTVSVGHASCRMYNILHTCPP